MILHRLFFWANFWFNTMLPSSTATFIFVQHTFPAFCPFLNAMISPVTLGLIYDRCKESLAFRPKLRVVTEFLARGVSHVAIPELQVSLQLLAAWESPSRRRLRCTFGLRELKPHCVFRRSGLNCIITHGTMYILQARSNGSTSNVRSNR